MPPPRFSPLPIVCCVLLGSWLVARQVHGGDLPAKSLSNWIMDELDIEPVFPFVRIDPAERLIRPGAVLSGPVRTSPAGGGVHWDLSAAKACFPKEDGRNDLQLGAERLDSPPLAVFELYRLSGLNYEVLSNITAARLSITNVAYRSIGSDVIASRSRTAAGCIEATSKGSRFVVRRTAAGRVTLEMTFKSRSAASKAKDFLADNLPQLGGPVSSEQAGNEVHTTTSSAVLIGITLRGDK